MRDIRNNIAIHHRSVRDLLKINSHEDFHDYLIVDAVTRYQSIHHKQGQDLGSVLAACADYKDALALKKFPFKNIVLTGIKDQNDRLKSIQETEPHISYQRQNCEAISLSSRSFDLIFCKEGLHHLARPVLGLYEMLRICRNAVIFIEPYNTVLGRIFEIFKLSSVYETSGLGNIDRRGNFVYRWEKRHLQFLLNSYYLDSGYHLDITLGWMSSRYNAHRSKLIRRLAAIGGWGVGFLPGCYGNQVTVMISPGTDLPPDPDPASLVDRY